MGHCKGWMALIDGIKDTQRMVFLRALLMKGSTSGVIITVAVCLYCLIAETNGLQMRKTQISKLVARSRAIHGDRKSGLFHGKGRDLQTARDTNGENNEYRKASSQKGGGGHVDPLDININKDGNCKAIQNTGGIKEGCDCRGKKLKGEEHFEDCCYQYLAESAGRACLEWKKGFVNENTTRCKMVQQQFSTCLIDGRASSNLPQLEFLAALIACTMIFFAQLRFNGN